MAKRSKAQAADAFVLELARAADDPSSEAFGRLLREGLAHAHWMAVEQAAKLVGRHQLYDYAGELAAIWDRFCENGAKVDPGCHAKGAALTALDQLERLDSEPFLKAVRYVQLEPVMGGSADTAGGVRERATFALLRQCHADALLYAAERLADAELPVRLGVAEALGTYGNPGAASLLVHRLVSGDEPDVLLACASSALRLEPEFLTPLLRGWLAGRDDARREIAALAFGQSKRPEHTELLIEWCEELGFEREIELAARALGMQRSERARQYLLGLVAGESVAKAHSAARTLAEHRYDPLVERGLREAAAKSLDARLKRLVEQLLAAR